LAPASSLTKRPRDLHTFDDERIEVLQRRADGVWDIFPGELPQGVGVKHFAVIDELPERRLASLRDSSNGDPRVTG